MYLVVNDEFYTMTPRDWDRLLGMVKIGGRWWFNMPLDERDWIALQHGCLY